MEFVLNKKLVGCTLIENGRLQKANACSFDRGTTGQTSGEPYICPDSEPPQQCINVLIENKFYEVSKRALEVAIA